MRLTRSLVVVYLLLITGHAVAETTEVHARGRLEQIVVHGPSLEGNLLEVSPERQVSIYLPPGYDSSADRRYPVLYLLHGIGDRDTTWTTRWKDEPWYGIADVVDRAIARGGVHEMIVVMPDAGTWSPGGIYFGSFYTNSPVTGGWEDFIVRDVVGHVDGHYRTLVAAESRGVAGHSMGGYGAIKLAMKHPDVFGAAYGLNSALLGWAGDVSGSNDAYRRAQEIDSVEAMMQDLQTTGEVYVPALLCVAQAFSPNPDRPPFYADLPFKVVDGHIEQNQPAHERWSANMPLRMLERYGDNLRKLRGLRFDSGVNDEFSHIVIASRRLSERLTAMGIEHQFEEYNGDHRDRLWGPHGRIGADLLPWMSSLLVPAPVEALVEAGAR